MARPAPARRAALAVIGELRRRQARCRDLLRSSAAVAALDARDRSLASRLALGAVATSGALDALLDAHLSPRVRLEPLVRDALRLATFELCWLQTPAAVAVSQGVELVRSVSPRAAGLANAVLRRVASRDAPARARLLARVREGSCASTDLAAVSGYPAWLVDEVIASRGEGFARDLALASLDAPPVHVAANLARHPSRDAFDLLVRAGTSPMATTLPFSFEIGEPSELAASGLVWSTDVIVADLSAQLVTLACAPAPGSRVLEVGQGRATKTLLFESAARAQGGRLRIVGMDSEAFKVRIASDRVSRAGLASQVSCLPLDARKLVGTDLPPELDAAFDLVFVDAPCSGLGTMRRHPEIPWRLSAESLAGDGSLPELQLDILSASAAQVRPGGLLAYSTCSPLKQEDEGVIRAFLASSLGRGFSVEPPSSPGSFSEPVAAAVREALTPEGFLLTPVTPEGADSHFCACLRRL